jgi:hypothetical protein
LQLYAIHPNIITEEIWEFIAAYVKWNNYESRLCYILIAENGNNSTIDVSQVAIYY